MVFSRNHHTEKELQSNESEVMRKWEVGSEIAGNKKYQQHRAPVTNYELKYKLLYIKAKNSKFLHKFENTSQCK